MTIVIGLPFILLSMVLGPLMTVVFVLAMVLLGMYTVEEVIGYDIEGYGSGLETTGQALLVLGAGVVSFFILKWPYGQEDGEDWLLAQAGNLSVLLRQKLQRQIAEIVHKDG